VVLKQTRAKFYRHLTYNARVGKKKLCEKRINLSAFSSPVCWRCWYEHVRTECGRR